MGKSSSSDPRSRILDAVGDGRSCRLVAAQFAAAPSTAIRLVRHFKRTGNREPVKQGRPCGYGKLAPHLDFLIAQGEEQPDATLPELAAILQGGAWHRDPSGPSFAGPSFEGVMQGWVHLQGNAAGGATGTR